MRALTNLEISQLEQQLCSCNDWTKVLVNENFKVENIKNSQFSGNVKLGSFGKTITLNSGEEIHSGIFNSKIHNCTIENDVLISNSRIANYEIKHDCRIENVVSLTVEGESTFGNGTVVHVLNEAGGRDVMIYDNLSAHIAYVLALYRHRTKTISDIESLIDAYTAQQKSTIGTIGENTVITNCKTLKNIKVGSFATLESVEKLCNGTICSDEENKTLVGCGVIANNFIIGKGSKVYDYVLIDNSFVGEACEIGKQYSAVDSLFFCNCQLFHGEACAIFAGPYTTSHHKASLLIGCMFSFYNAGSGTNQSNHMYKLGPIHQGILERGSKTGSDSYMMLEVRTGAFSVVLGHHEKHFDTSNLPFSYILNDEGKSTLIPAINLLTVGTQRDAKKWATRDKRKGKIHTDHIIFDMFNPYTIEKIKCGIETLSEMEQTPSAYHFYKNVRVKDIFVQRGQSIYRNAITLYLGQKIAQKLADNNGKITWSNDTNKDQKWIDCLGLVISQNELDKILTDIDNNKLKDLSAVNLRFEEFYKNYETHEWNYVCQMLQWFLQKKCTDITNDDIKQLLIQYQDAINSQMDSVFADAGKEFDATFKVGFGIDNLDDRDADFIAVQGTPESNSVLQKMTAEKDAKITQIKNLIATL